MPLSTVLTVLLCVWTLVQNINGQRLHSTPSSKLITNVTFCPLMLLSPSISEPYFGKRAVFTAFVEAKLDHPIDARWQRIKNGRNESIDIYSIKYDETQNLPSPKLVINNVTFDDVGYYQLQVRISGGWCTSSRRVHLRNVWGNIDECISTGSNSCDVTKETCENTDGGYICNCLKGYRKLDDTCNEINECIEGTSGCQQICKNTPGSFNCLCHPGFNLNEDNSTCNKTDNDLCRDFEKECEYACSTIDGTTQCICPSGYKLTDNGINCTDVDECSLDTSPCDQECDNMKGSFICICRPGYSLNADKTSCSVCDLPNYGENCSQVCECGPGVKRCDPVSGCICLPGWTEKNCSVDIDECQLNPSICGSNKLCHNTEGSYRCDCLQGFKLIEDKCEDIDECDDASLNDCPVDTTQCMNTFGNYTCECKEGYQRKSSVCEDIDECKTPIHGCSQKCENADGGYSCLCFFGFTLKDDRKTCEKMPARDSCSLFPELNCSYGCKQVAHYDHTGICFCETGYKLAVDRKTCKVCELPNYGENCSQVCECGPGVDKCDPVRGCVCLPGWTEKNCSVDIDECQLNPSICGSNKLCHNTEGSYQCDCLQGFKLIEDKCEDIDECNDASLNDCPVDTTQCRNMFGNYSCECKEGYQKRNSVCEDIDECETPTHGCSQKCENANGGYSCLCVLGFTVKDDRKTCEKVPDRDSCSFFPELNCSYGCKQLAYDDHNGVCFCETGYELAEDGKTCKDIDECVENIDNCSKDALCTDTVGSFNCSCFKGFKGDGYDCAGCRDFTFGEQCSEACSCIVNNSQNCDAETGICICKTGWEASDCSQDVDECEEKIIECDTSLYQVCVNIPGSARCECRFGGLNITDCNHPKPPHRTNQTEVKIKTEATFYIKINRVEFLTNSEKWRQGFEISLMKFYQTENVRGFSTILILTIRQPAPNYGGQQSGAIRQESVIIDYEIIGSEKESSKLKTDLATSMGKLLSGKKKIKVLDQAPVIKDITIKDSNGAPIENISVSSSPCSVFKGFGGTCSDGEICDDSLGIASCVKLSSPLSDKTILIIATGVSIPVLMIIIAVLITCLYCQRKSKHLENTISKRVENLESKMRVNNESDLKLKSDLSNYDSIDSTTDGNTNEYCELSDVPRHFYANTKDEGHSYANYTSDSFYDMPFTNE
ncbi:fibrillin-2-like isoform X2 [Ostrea edulis]|uniref:fibrillin-2-like isoform X2 n=1 Tax=Ostrea edulis TaxID=37623 RepID=UPI0024AF5703|nr:fibrillin-2-like isoform X2 [Ostrea edulis]